MNDNGGPAFPVLEGTTQWLGLSVRDYFAAKILGGISAVTNVDFGSHQDIAKMCYKIADAMLEARK